MDSMTCAKLIYVPAGVLSSYAVVDVLKFQHQSRIGHAFAVEVEHKTGNIINTFSGKVNKQYFLKVVRHNCWLAFASRGVVKNMPTPADPYGNMRTRNFAAQDMMNAMSATQCVFLRRQYDRENWAISRLMWTHMAHFSSRCVIECR